MVRLVIATFVMGSTAPTARPVNRSVAMVVLGPRFTSLARGFTIGTASVVRLESEGISKESRLRMTHTNAAQMVVGVLVSVAVSVRRTALTTTLFLVTIRTL